MHFKLGDFKQWRRFQAWTRLLRSESKTIKLDMVVAMLMQTNLTFLNDNIDLFLKNAICFVPDS